jgi:hypothetical protein
MKQGIKELLYVILVLVALFLVLRFAKGAQGVGGTAFHGVQGTIKALQGR